MNSKASPKILFWQKRLPFTFVQWLIEEHFRVEKREERKDNELDENNENPGALDLLALLYVCAPIVTDHTVCFIILWEKI